MYHHIKRQFSGFPFLAAAAELFSKHVFIRQIIGREAEERILGQHNVKAKHRGYTNSEVTQLKAFAKGSSGKLEQDKS